MVTVKLTSSWVIPTCRNAPAIEAFTPALPRVGFARVVDDGEEVFDLLRRRAPVAGEAAPLAPVLDERKLATGRSGRVLPLGEPEQFLGSAIGLALAAALTLFLAGRIVGEERLLVEELDGYAEYRNKVRFRLLPPIW